MTRSPCSGSLMRTTCRPGLSARIRSRLVAPKLLRIASSPWPAPRAILAWRCGLPPPLWVRALLLPLEPGVREEVTEQLGRLVTGVNQIAVHHLGLGPPGDRALAPHGLEGVEERAALGLGH